MVCARVQVGFTSWEGDGASAQADCTQVTLNSSSHFYLYFNRVFLGGQGYMNSFIIGSYFWLLRNASYFKEYIVIITIAPLKYLLWHLDFIDWNNLASPLSHLAYGWKLSWWGRLHIQASKSTVLHGCYWSIWACLKPDMAHRVFSELSCVRDEPSAQGNFLAVSEKHALWITHRTPFAVVQYADWSMVTAVCLLLMSSNTC